MSTKFTFAIIFTLFLTIAKSQDLHLYIYTSDKESDSILNNYHYHKIHTSLKSIHEEVNQLNINIQKDGFLSSRINEIQKVNDSTFNTYIYFGPKRKYIKAKVPKKDQHLLKSFNIENDSTTFEWKEFERKIKSQLDELDISGHPLSSIRLTQIEDRIDYLLGELESIIPEKTRRFDKIEINSDFKSPKNIQKNINRRYRKKTYNSVNLKDLENRLSKFKFATLSTSPEIEFRTDSTIAYARFKKSKNNLFDGLIGFSNNENGKMTLSGYLDLQLQNLLKTGEQIQINWKNESKTISTFKGFVNFDYIGGSSLTSQASLELIKQDSTFQNTTTNLKLGYIIQPNIKVYLGRKSTESASISNVSVLNNPDFKNNFTILNFQHVNIEEHPLFPIKSSIDLNIGYGTRKSNTVKNQQFYSHLIASHNFQLSNHHFFHVQNDTYLLVSDHYLNNEMYRFGGIQSLRGVSELQLQASRANILSTEYRWAPTDELYLHSVMDYATYKDESSNLKNTITSFGIGTAFKTNVGMIKIMYTNAIEKGNRFDFKNSILHLSLKNNF